MEVTEMWAGRRLMHDHQGWTACSTYMVTGAASEAEAAKTITVREGDEHPTYPNLYALEPGRPERLPGGSRWEVRVIYRERCAVPPVITALGEHQPVLIA